MVLNLNEMPAGEEVPAGFGGSHHGFGGSHHGFGGSHHGFGGSHHGFGGSHRGCHGVPFHGAWETLTSAQLRVLFNMVEVPVNYHRIHHVVTHQPNGRAEHSWVAWPPTQHVTRRGTTIHSFEWKSLFHGTAPPPPPAPAPATASRAPVRVAPPDLHTSPVLSMMEGRRSSVRLEELDSSSDDTTIPEGPLLSLGSVPTRRRSCLYRQNQQAEHIGSSSQQGAKNQIAVEDIRAAPPPTLEQRRPAIQIRETVQPPAPKRNCNNRGLHRALRKAHHQKWTSLDQAGIARDPPAVSAALPPRHPGSTSQAGGGVHRSSPSLATILSVSNLRRPTSVWPTSVPAAPVRPVPVRLDPVPATSSVPSSAGKKRPSTSSDTMSVPAGSPKFKLFNVEIDVAAENARHAAGGSCHGGHGNVNGNVNPPGAPQNRSGAGSSLYMAPPLVREENRSHKLFKPTPRRCNTTAEWSPYNMSW